MAQNKTEVQKKITCEQQGSYAQMLVTGAATNPILASAIAEMRARQVAIKKEQDTLLSMNLIKLEELPDLSGETLVKQVKLALAQDHEYMVLFNEKLDRLSLQEQAKVPFAVRFNKMAMVIESVRTTIFETEEENIMKIANGKLPFGLENAIGEFPVLGAGNFWGTSKTTFLSYAILAVNFALHGTTMQDLPLTSAITHVSPLPSSISLDPKCRFSYYSQIGVDQCFCFGYVHSGYSFGAYRGEEQKLHYNKQFGPEDCSSWVAKITNSQILFSTADQLCSYRTQIKTGFVPAGWLTSQEARDMVLRYDAVISTNDIQPGDIFFCRKFRQSQNPNLSIGTGGHTAIVLNKSEDKLATLSFNREMPFMEGFGIEEFSLTQVVDRDNVRLPMFQRVRLK